MPTKELTIWHMPSKAALIFAFAFVPLAYAQVDRVLHFSSTESVQDFQEIGAVVGKIADIQTTVDALFKKSLPRSARLAISGACSLTTR
jgi:hypothetical protein